MNGLSWLIYAADVAGSAKVVAVIAIPISLVVMITSFVGAWMAKDFANIYADSTYPGGQEKYKGYLANASGWSRVRKPSLQILAAAIVVAVVIPSSGTLYAIAASEMGERVLNSETGGKAVEALNAWLDRQIAGEK